MLHARFNLRDLGGLPVADGGRVRDGRLFRGAGLHRLEPDDLLRLEPLGLRTAIDLRSGEEAAAGTFAGPGADVRHLPIFEDNPVFDDVIEDAAVTLADVYMWMLGQGGASIAAVFELLAEPGSYPAVVYCAAGKDRTGIVCALVLDLIGVGREAIAADYARSEAAVAEMRRWAAARAPERRNLVPAEIYTAPAAAMRRFLESVEAAYGSVDGYLEEIGVAVAPTRAALREGLVTE